VSDDSEPEGVEDAGGESADEADAAIPEWEDPYLDRVAHRLKFNFDLERDRRIDGERYPLYGRMLIQSEKRFFHPGLSYARQENREHLLVRRVDDLRVDDLERAVETGNHLADEWVDADEEHQGTEFTFVFVTRDLTPEVASFVDGFRERTLLKYGYYGHYEVNLVVVAPETESYVASDNADVWRAFAPWADADPDSAPGLFARLRGLLR
jgi:hypothetical protein